MPPFFRLSSAQLSRGQNVCQHICRSRAPLRHQRCGGNSLIGIPNFKSPRYYFSLFRQFASLLERSRCTCPDPKCTKVQVSAMINLHCLLRSRRRRRRRRRRRFSASPVDLSHSRVRNLTAPKARRLESVTQWGRFPLSSVTINFRDRGYEEN